MASTTPLRLSTFADRFPAEMVERVEKLAKDLVDTIAAELGEMIEEPVTTGALRASRQLAELKRGLRLGWTHPGAAGINTRRIKSKPYQRSLPSGKKTRPFSRMLGSEKRPEGFTRPALEELRRGWEKIAAGVGEEFNR